MKIQILMTLTFFVGLSQAEGRQGERPSHRYDTREIENPGDVAAKDALRLAMVARQTELDARINDLNASLATHTKAATEFKAVEKRWIDFECAESQRPPMKIEDLQELEALRIRKNDYSADETLLREILALHISGILFRLSDLMKQINLDKPLVVDWTQLDANTSPKEIDLMKKFVRSIDNELKLWRSLQANYRDLKNLTPRLRALQAVLKNDAATLGETRQWLETLKEEAEQNIKILENTSADDLARRTQKESLLNSYHLARSALDAASILVANTQKIKNEAETRRDQATEAYNNKTIGRITIKVHDDYVY